MRRLKKKEALCRGVEDKDLLIGYKLDCPPAFFYIRNHIPTEVCVTTTFIEKFIFRLLNAFNLKYFKPTMEITRQTIADIKLLAFKNKKENATFFRQVAAKPPGKVDEAFQNLHEEVFAEVNCLECGNCCKSLGPKLNTTDIRRISSVLRIKASEFEQKYLRMDEDGDFVFSIMPCVFLAEDNSCQIYEDRPRACREYPHTDQRKMHQVLDITLKNLSVCPAVSEIVERLKKVRI